MNNAVSTADLAWWQTPCHARPDVEPGVTDRLVDELARICDHTAVGKAARHTIWALSWRARRDGAAIQVAVRYVANGTGLSLSTAAIACNRVADVLGATRDRNGFWTVPEEGLAACFDLTGILVDQMPEPKAGGSEGPPLPIGPELHVVIPPHARGKTRCPCGEHRNDDAHASMAFDRRTGLGTCMTTRSVFRLNPEAGTAQMVRRGSSGTPLDLVGSPGAVVDRTKAYPGGGDRPASAPPAEAPQFLRGRVLRDASPSLPGLVLSGTLTGVQRGRFVVTDLKKSVRWGEKRQIRRMHEGSERRYGGVKSMQAAEAAAVAIAGIGPEVGPMLWPERFWSLDRFHPQMGPEFSNGSRRVVGYENAGSCLSLLDLDGLDSAETDPDLKLAAKIRRAVRRASGGRLSVESIVATSRQGMQVAVRWDRFWWDSGDIYRDPARIRLLRRVAASVLRLLGRGGYADECAWAGNRYGRRAGWRVGKDGRAVRARLWWARG